MPDFSLREFEAEFSPFVVGTRGSGAATFSIFSEPATAVSAREIFFNVDSTRLLPLVNPLVPTQ